KLMRQTLQSSTMEKITIEEELALLKNYLDLEKLRFNNAFDYVFETEENIDAAYTEIPSMLLQPYAENAVLHGLRHKKENGLLRIIFLYQFENILCIIEDNGIGRNASAGINSRRENHQSKGSSVTANRLALLSKNGQAGARVLYLDLEDELGNATGTRVEITIPLAY
ncbi:MAG: histidine kinase, partial [Bacteroidota bacterium]